MIALLALEDARILLALRPPDTIYWTKPPRCHEDFTLEELNDVEEFELDAVQAWLAVRTVQRHLPAPIVYHSFSYFVGLGRARAAGARFVPYRPGVPFISYRARHQP